ncbi:metallophosphoesterase [Aureimonas sp. Leaf454]|uniref:metallophosphoesterase n=1 Tax=Aureimonas sp. Leaf454 TaxID=1736381 RepID=UPI0007009571|nr:metallophosphoesterase [Aureimonas sp. Leaf454]KQT48983.1 metallophosphoesterase [Aureimonas sp. Leaf454]
MTSQRLLIISDLHQGEGGPPYDPARLSDQFDIVVVAGDCAGRLTSSITWLADRFAGTPTIYTPGNHDFYRDEGPDGFTIEDETEAGQELADRLGIHLLVDGEANVGGLRFLGSTLWTDLRAGVHHSLSHASGDARRGMNDYRRIHRRSSTRRSRRLDPSDTLSLHHGSRRFLESAFSTSDGSRTVVVSHHAPSIRSLEIPSADLNQCYASDLEPEIERWRPNLWVHGHIHTARDYRIGSTRIVCNPAGRAEERTGFDPGLIVDVD